MKRLGSKQWIAVAAFALIVLVTTLFAVRTIRRAIYWRIHRDEVIRPWMSIPYVAHSYQVPPRVLYDALNLTPQPHDRRPLRELAREENKPVAEVIQTLQAEIARQRASSSPTLTAPSPGRSP